MAGPVVLAPTIAAARNSYADLLRTLAIVAVVFGHWLATAVVVRDGRFVGVDALGVIGWGSWVTLGLQVVPVFFLVGGYANAVSWTRHAADGEQWSEWVRARVMRLLIPTCGYAALIAVAVALTQLAGLNRATVGQAAWAVALHLWFLATYVVVLLCTPMLYAAHRRWGLGVPLAMAALAVLIDIGVIEAHVPVIGWANYLLVWGTFHQLGFAWQDRSLAARISPALLALGATAVLVALIWWGPYPVSMVGVPGARIQNASPPSTALLAFGVAQAGVVIALERGATRWLSRRPRTEARIAAAGALTMPVYLWHMVPVVIVIEAGYPHVVGLAAVGSSRWWEQRVAWIVALAVTLALVLALLALVARMAQAARTAQRIAAGHRHQVAGAPVRVEAELDGPSGRPVNVAALIVGVALTAAGIGQLAVSGFAPHGRLALGPLVELALALACVGASRRPGHPADVAPGPEVGKPKG